MLRVINTLDDQNMLTTWGTPPANHSSIPKPDIGRKSPQLGGPNQNIAIMFNMSLPDGEISLRTCLFPHNTQT